MAKKKSGPGGPGKSVSHNIDRGTLTSSDLPKLDNPNLPTLWCDIAAITARREASGHDLVLLRFYAMLPDARLEVARLQMTALQAKQLSTSIASLLDFHIASRAAAEANVRVKTRATPLKK